jgi:hypothetical protein
MTETLDPNLPAVRGTDLDQLARIGTWLALSESGSDSEKAKGAAAALRLYYAQTLDLPPLAAAEISVIKGRLFLSAQLLRALAMQNGYLVERTDSTDESCTATLFRPSTGELIGSATYTMEDARKAGLIRQGSAWQTNPARMLWARASKNVIVDFAPQIALGISLDDELQEITGEIVHEHDSATDATVEVEWPDEEPTSEAPAE